MKEPNWQSILSGLSSATPESLQRLVSAMPQVSAKPALHQMFATSFLIREVEHRLLELFAAGKLSGTVHTCIGQELTGVAVAQSLAPGDFIFSNHRCHGHFLARTGKIEGLIAEIMGKETGVCGGRGGSQHLCDAANGFFSNGIQGGIVPVSAGLAYALELRGSDNIAVVFIGDGTFGEGVVYETLNVASKWELPLLIVVENNGYAQSTAQTQTLAGDIASRAAAFEVAFRQSSTWEPEKLLDQADECVGYVRRERRPLLFQIDTYRLMAHSKSDDDRNPEEIASYWAKDSLERFARANPESAAAFRDAAKAHVDEVVSQAMSAPYPESSRALIEVKTQADVRWKPATFPSSDRAVASIRDSLRRNMQRDARIVLLGEDIESPYGGAFKVTKGLSEEFPGRVRNTPISEASIVGLGNGLALAGFVPVCEIMFGDFLALAADQLINHASKFRYMYNDQVRVPLVVRTPMGGRRGYGPTHSQSLEKHFLGLPDTTMLALNQRCDPGFIYDVVFSSIDGPMIVIENKLLYASRLGLPVKAGYRIEHSNDRFPTVRLKPSETPEVTVFCYGGMLPIAEEAVAAALEEFEIVSEIICPSQIYPLDPASVIQSLAQTRRLVILEEGVGFGGLGAELIAKVHERSAGLMQSGKRVSPPEHPIPSCALMENEILPNVERAVAAIVECVRHV